MWQAINLPHHLIFENPARELANKLNEIGASAFILISDIDENIDGVA